MKKQLIQIISQQKPKGFKALPSFVDTGEGSTELNLCTTFQTSPVLCEYQKSICPKNVPKYSMKCIFNKRSCSIKKYFDRYRKEDLGKLGIGGMK